MRTLQPWAWAVRIFAIIALAAGGCRINNGSSACYTTSYHYFMSSLESEIQALDNGMLPGWTRTGQIFNAYTNAVASANPVCGFYLSPAYGDSHFLLRLTRRSEVRGARSAKIP